MAYELVRTVVQKVLQDKILLGLVVICILGLFVGGMTMNDEKGDKKGDKEQAAEQAPAGDQQQPQQQAAAVPGKLTPDLAANFLGWWLQNGAMDYNAPTAIQSHQVAMQWMTPDAANAFQNSFWTPQIAESVATGRLVAAFQPTGIQPQAVNPDGSVVLGVTGTMVVQTGAQPAVQQFSGAFLVRQEPEGLRVAGLDARGSAIPGSSVY
jgi:hypothetical protein